MQALLNLSNPTTQLTSLRHFYDTTENHITGLSAMRQLDVVTVDLITESNEPLSLDSLVVPVIAAPL